MSESTSSKIWRRRNRRNDPLTHHLLAVWNPAYASDALDATLDLLRATVAAHRAGTIPEEDVYVWWGKVRSSNRQQALPHLEAVLALDSQLRGDDGPPCEMHLYLTDYQSLYVAHVGEITAENVLDDDPDMVPDFYSAQNLNCDCWFRLWDIRRVVSSDLLGVIEELRKLRNTRYHDRPVSIYGGMVELPLIVTRSDGARYFDADVRRQLTDSRFWVEFDAERAGLGRMERELRDNLIGDTAWRGLDPVARSFVATAERIFRDHSDELGFDLSAVIVNFAKAFEVQTNLLLRQALAGAPSQARFANVAGQTVDVTTGRLWSLGELASILGNEHAINATVRRALRNGDWFAASLPAVLRELADLRNPAAHSGRANREVVTRIRNQLLGVGVPGALVELGKVRPLSPSSHLPAP
jgi:hypothetical protein